MSKILCFMDFEYTTTGDKKVDFKKDCIELLSIGAVFVDAYTNKKLESYYEVVRPRKNVLLSDYCKELTKINQLEVDSARCMEEVVNDFLSVCNKYDNINYYIWGNFDYIALKKTVKINQYSGEFKRIINKLKNIQPRVSQSIVYNGEILNTEWGLQKVRVLYGMDESENKHNALSDAVDLWEIYTAYRNKENLNEDILKEEYDKKIEDRNEVIRRRLQRHSDEINELWEQIIESGGPRIQGLSRGELKRFALNIPIEYKGISTISYHEKTISIVGEFSNKNKEVGMRIKGRPLAQAKQYKYTDLRVNLIPNLKRDIDTKLEIPIIEIEVYHNTKKIYSMVAEVRKSTRKIIIGFIKSVFLNNRYIK